MNNTRWTRDGIPGAWDPALSLDPRMMDGWWSIGLPGLPRPRLPTRKMRESITGPPRYNGPLDLSRRTTVATHPTYCSLAVQSPPAAHCPLPTLPTPSAKPTGTWCGRWLRRQSASPEASTLSKTNLARPGPSTRSVRRRFLLPPLPPPTFETDFSFFF